MSVESVRDAANKISERLPQIKDMFEKWWKREYPHSMMGSKYLARKAYIDGHIAAYTGEEE